jgi:hypothetical protein
MLEVKQLLEQDPDYIAIKRYGNSLAALEKRYLDSIPTRIIAAALEMTEEQVEEEYQKIISCIRSNMGVR